PPADAAMATSSYAIGGSMGARPSCTASPRYTLPHRIGIAAPARVPHELCSQHVMARQDSWRLNRRRLSIRRVGDHSSSDLSRLSGNAMRAIHDVITTGRV